VKGANEWREILWVMAKGDAINYDSLKRKDTFEFFALFQTWEKHIKINNKKK